MEDIIDFVIKGIAGVLVTSVFLGIGLQCYAMGLAAGRCEGYCAANNLEASWAPVGGVDTCTCITAPKWTPVGAP